MIDEVNNAGQWVEPLCPDCSRVIPVTGTCSVYHGPERCPEEITPSYATRPRRCNLRAGHTEDHESLDGHVVTSWRAHPATDVFDVYEDDQVDGCIQGLRAALDALDKP